MASRRMYTAGDLSNTLNEARRGASMWSVARKYRFLHSTLHDHLEGKLENVGQGGPTVLTAAEEREIVQACIALADMGFGVIGNWFQRLCMTMYRRMALPIHSLMGCQEEIGGSDS